MLSNLTSTATDLTIAVSKRCHSTAEGLYFSISTASRIAWRAFIGFSHTHGELLAVEAQQVALQLSNDVKQGCTQATLKLWGSGNAHARPFAAFLLEKVVANTRHSERVMNTILPGMQCLGSAIDSLDAGASDVTNKIYNLQVKLTNVSGRKAYPSCCIMLSRFLIDPDAILALCRYEGHL